MKAKHNYKKARCEYNGVYIKDQDGTEYAADALTIGKLYKVVPPESNDPEDDLRVIDDSGEDYLYPAKFFVLID